LQIPVSDCKRKLVISNLYNFFRCISLQVIIKITEKKNTEVCRQKANYKE